jgi:hypothetical protein
MDAVGKVAVGSGTGGSEQRQAVGMVRTAIGFDPRQLSLRNSHRRPV